jgi:hypothetical protein
MKYLAFILVVIFSCTVKHSNVNKTLILGTWNLSSYNNSINYVQISFYEDSLAIFRSKADTIYRFKFYVEKNCLHIKSNNGNKEYYLINKLDSEKLVFNSLRENKSVQTYKKLKH